MINWDTSRLVIVCYPQGAGGKFLINCLGLSDQCVFQHAVLAAKGISRSEKIQWINEHLALSESSGKWKDLGLGCTELFGMHGSEYLINYPEVLVQQLNPVIHHLSNGNKYFFITAHNTIYAQAYLKFWKNARVIVFNNHRPFIDQRYSRPENHKILAKFWNNVRDPSWPATPPKNIDELVTLPDAIQKELLIPFNNEIQQYMITDSIFDENYLIGCNQLIESLPQDQYFIWDTQAYNSIEQLLPQLDQCCRWLNIDSANSTEVNQYFTNWQQVLDLITKRYSNQ
jgi:hypothetical protein